MKIDSGLSWFEGRGQNRENDVLIALLITGAKPKRQEFTKLVSKIGSEWDRSSASGQAKRMMFRERRILELICMQPSVRATTI